MQLQEQHSSSTKLASKRHERAFNGMKPTEFVKKVDNIAYFLGNTDGNFAEQHHYKKLALDLALQGFCKGEELIGMQYEELPATYQKPVIAMALQRMLETIADETAKT